LRYIEKDLGNRDFAYIIPISDLHIGDVYFNEEKFIKLRDWVKEQENAFVILLGDILNCATKNSISDVYSEKKRKGLSSTKVPEKSLQTCLGRFMYIKMC
jgi:predicted MPP superfamily phosphohydrolase